MVANNGVYEFGENEAGLFEFDGKSWRKLSGKPHMDVAARENLGGVLFATGWEEASVVNRIWGVKPVCQHLRVIPDDCAFRGLFVAGGSRAMPDQDVNALGGQPQSGLRLGKTEALSSWDPPQGWGGLRRNTPVQRMNPPIPSCSRASGAKRCTLRRTATGRSTSKWTCWAMAHGVATTVPLWGAAP